MFLIISRYCAQSSPVHSHCHTIMPEKISYEQFTRSITKKIRMPLSNRPKTYLTLYLAFYSSQNKCLWESRNRSRTYRNSSLSTSLQLLSAQAFPELCMIAIHLLILSSLWIHANCSSWQHPLARSSPSLLSVAQRDVSVDLFWTMLLLAWLEASEILHWKAYGDGDFIDLYHTLPQLSLLHAGKT